MSWGRVFRRKEFVAFLRAVDRRLHKPVRLDLIGQGVAVLSFGAKSGTADLDVTGDLTPIAAILDQARAETGLPIPVSTVGVFDAPHLYEDRVRAARIPGLKRLQVVVPEKHDWALIKIVRLLDKDIEDIAEVAEKDGFDRDVFLERFLNEMTDVIGRKADLVLNFLAMMEHLFGEKESERMKRVIREDPRWS